MSERRGRPWGPYLLLAVGSVGYACYLFAWFSIAAYLTPISTELGLSNTAAGLLAGAVPLTYVPFALASGLVIDRVGSRRAIGLGLLVVGVAHVGRGVASTYPVMLALTLLLGVSGTGLTFGLPKLVSDLFPPERSGTMSSVYLVGLYAGTAGAFGPGRGLLGPMVGGWRPLFLWSGVVTVGVALVWLVLARGIGSRPAVGADTDGTGATQTFSLASLLADVRRVVTHRNLLLLVVVGTMYLFVIHGLQGWLTVVLEGRGLAPARAASITSGLIVAQLLGTLVLPPLSDYLGNRRGVIAACGVFMSAGTGGILLLGGSVLPVALAVGAVGFGLGGLATFVRALPLEMDGIGSDLAGAAVGLVFMVGEAGGFAGPFVIGVLEDLTGSFAPGLLLATLAGLVVVAATIPLRGVDGSDEASPGQE
jgi:cyanate permease